MERPALPTLEKEIALLEQGYSFIAGLDEAGRGAWAGPVVAAAVILPLNRPTLLTGLQDSKKLTAQARDNYFTRINQVALAVGVGAASPLQVDELNVVEATRWAMQQALARLNPGPDYLLLDYLALPAIQTPQEAFPRAESISLTVAAASVIAKVSRDRLMVEYSAQYPQYAFERHKGYGTEAHRLALAEHGPCPLHRMSYKPLHVFKNP